jgi:hypothetical protein
VPFEFAWEVDWLGTSCPLELTGDDPEDVIELLGAIEAPADEDQSPKDCDEDHVPDCVEDAAFDGAQPHDEPDGSVDKA